MKDWYFVNKVRIAESYKSTKEFIDAFNLSSLMYGSSYYNYSLELIKRHSIPLELFDKKEYRGGIGIFGIPQMKHKSCFFHTNDLRDIFAVDLALVSEGFYNENIKEFKKLETRKKRGTSFLTISEDNLEKNGLGVRDVKFF